MAIQRIDEFLTQLKRIEHNPLLVEKLCNDELHYLRQAYEVKDEADKGVYKGLRVYLNAIANYRKAIYEYANNHIARNYFKMSEVDSLHKNNQDQTAKMRGLSDTDSTISNIDGYIDMSVKLCNAPSYADNILGIAALTGRRVSEVAYFSTFNHCDKEAFNRLYNQYGVIECDGLMIENLAKKENYEMKNLRLKHDEPFINQVMVPVLYDADYILQAVEDLRCKKSFESHTQFHNQASKELSKRVKKHYQEFLGVCASHDLRKAYCRIVFDYYANMPEKAVLDFYSVILAQKSPGNYAKFSCE
jgi:hypothetical protein